MPDQITKLLDQIDRLDQQATEGPWLSHYGGNPHDQWLSVEPEKGSRTICTVTDDHHPNAEFIALARTALPTLSRAVRAVLELHKPRVHDEDPTSPFCNFCGPGAHCETTQAITNALGVDGA